MKNIYYLCKWIAGSNYPVIRETRIKMGLGEIILQKILNYGLTDIPVVSVL